MLNDEQTIRFVTKTDTGSGCEEKMRICHIITGLNDGGAEAVLYRLCTSDTENRHVVISLMDEGKYGPLLRAAGVEVYALGMPRRKVTIGALFRLWRLLRSVRPDVVQTWMYHADLVGGVVARFAGVSTVCWGIRHTTLELGLTPRTTIMVARTCAGLSHWIPTAIVSCSHEAARVHQALGYAARKFVVVPNGYDLERFSPDAEARERLRAEWGVDAQTPLIGMVARFDPQKDHANLLAALGLLKQQGVKFRCVLVGTGMDNTNEDLTKRIAEAGLDEYVYLLGPRDDIPAIMNTLDVHVLSSAGEAFPNVLAEAMACGTPCVTTDVGDAALIVGETGWVVPPKDSRALTEALVDALTQWQNRDSWQARKSACRERIATHFTLDAMISGYRKVWVKAAESTRTTSVEAPRKG